MTTPKALRALLGLVMVGGYFLPGNEDGDPVQRTGGRRRHSMTTGQFKKYRHSKRIARRSRQLNAR